ncbi:lipase family protein [Methylococcus capsulatus str. Bath]|jgi:hypothetical protein|uniref:Lipase family protein n=4 Tax=Methylococcus TaxID=413 RepID=Q60CN0_METCA|nr:lipase family protein [Methylococcus capsulatus]AAU90766.1 lipase family protein [Methylococcus capsulatus str. Bath]CAI8786687.1 Lipase family protein [Methylococcus capsulatus]
MSTFDRGFARLLLEICRYTYAKAFALAPEEGDALQWIEQQGGKPDPASLEPIRGGDTSVACVFRYPDKNVVAYMGTKTEFDNAVNAKDSIEDWLNNFRAAPVPFKLGKEHLGLDKEVELPGRVHAGFLSELKAVQAKVIDVLSKNGGKDKPLYLTGHSQGGAEATLATVALLAGGFKVAATYTFAAPRAGDRTFADAVPAEFPFHRIEFGDDIVPHVPPTLLSRWVKTLVTVPRHLPLKRFGVPVKVNEFLELSVHDLGYVGVGRLCYGNHESGQLHVDMSVRQEASLFLGRLTRLLRHPEHWAEHHHLAGTRAEVSAGKKGNYTALVSDFPIVEG